MPLKRAVLLTPKSIVTFNYGLGWMWALTGPWLTLEHNRLLLINALSHTRFMLKILFMEAWCRRMQRLYVLRVQNRGLNVRYFISCVNLTILRYVVRWIHGFLIDHVEIVSVCAFHLCGLHVGNGRWLELGVYDFQRITHHIIRLG